MSSESYLKKGMSFSLASGIRTLYGSSRVPLILDGKERRISFSIAPRMKDFLGWMLARSRLDSLLMMMKTVRIYT